MIRLEENQGIPRSLIILMAVVAGLTVANLYYNQPLLELMRAQLGTSEAEANLITVITQAGYAAGLCFLIPAGDLYSRRRLIVSCMTMAAVMALVIGFATSVYVVWAASLVMGACSVIPQFFMPIAGQYSQPRNKARNMGYVLSGLLVGILGARVVGGFVGQWLGWRAMFFISAGIMAVCLVLTLYAMPAMKANFSGTYRQLMRSVVHIVATHRQVRINSLRGGFAFGSFLAVWSCLAFHLSRDFGAGSDMVGLLGLCGLAGAMAASGMGRLVPVCGVRALSIVGALLQVAGWGLAWFFGHSLVALAAAVIVIDVGLQCQQLSNQSDCLRLLPEAGNRANTIFMTTYFVGGALGTLLAGWGWELGLWPGVCAVGVAMALCSIAVSLLLDVRPPQC